MSVKKVQHKKDIERYIEKRFFSQCENEICLLSERLENAFQMKSSRLHALLNLADKRKYDITYDGFLQGYLVKKR